MLHTMIGLLQHSDNHAKVSGFMVNSPPLNQLTFTKLPTTKSQISTGGHLTQVLCLASLLKLTLNGS